MEVWIVSTTVNVKIAQFFLQLQRGADHLCPVQPDQHGWMYSRRGDISKKWFLLMWKNDIWDINSTQISHCQAYTHTDGRALFASGSPFPDFQGFGKVREDFISCFLSIGNIFFVNIFDENQFLCRLTSQARATMRTSSLVPAWRSLRQVRILCILCWLDLNWQFWLCWSLSTPRDPSHFGRSFPLCGGSAGRYGVRRRSCSRQVKRRQGNISWVHVQWGSTPLFVVNIILM